MIVTAFKTPLSPSPVVINACANNRCCGFISFIGNPTRTRGMKCQFSRSSPANGNIALPFCSASKVPKNAFATSAI